MPIPIRRALLVVDVQEEYVSGDLPIEYPAVNLSLSNIGRAMQAARELAIPIVVVQNSAPASSPIFAKGSARWQLHPLVATAARAHYIEKALPSAFAGTDLAEWIARNQIDTLCLAGYMTHNCIAATAFEAVHRGLSVEVLSDATGSVPYGNAAGRSTAREIHHAFCVVMQSRFALVLETGDWITALAAGVLPPRDTIFGSNQNARAARTARAA